MSKNDLFECKPGECRMSKVSDVIKNDLFEHLQKQLTLIKDQHPGIHKGCITKVFAEQLIETGHYLLGELIVLNMEAHKKQSEIMEKLNA